MLGGVRFGVSSSLYLDAIFDVLLVIVVQPLGASGIIWQKEDNGQDRENPVMMPSMMNSQRKPGNTLVLTHTRYCLSLTLQAGLVVEMAHSICNCSAKGTGCRSRGQNESDPDRSLLDWIPKAITKSQQDCMLR